MAYRSWANDEKIVVQGYETLTVNRREEYVFVVR